MNINDNKLCDISLDINKTVSQLSRVLMDDIIKRQSEKFQTQFDTPELNQKTIEVDSKHDKQKSTHNGYILNQYTHISNGHNILSAPNKTLADSISTISNATYNDSKQQSVLSSPQFINFDVNTVRRDFPILQEIVNGKPLIWFDNGATSQKPNDVVNAISYYYKHINSNIHRGVHTLSKRASDEYDRARQTVARFLNAGNTNEIIFTKGTTEAINLIAASFGPQVVGRGDDIIITQLEHHANILPWQRLAQIQGANLKVIPITQNADLIISEYERLLSNRTKIVAFTHVSNATGTLLPVKTLTKMAKHYGAYVVIDGAQSVPHMKIDCQLLGCDFFALSGHKMFAPTGIGVLFGKQNLLEQMLPYQVGGGMIQHVTHEQSIFAPAPFKFEAGTGNLADVTGLVAAINYLEKLGYSNIERYEHELVKYAYQQLKTIPSITMIGDPEQRIGVLSFIVNGIDNDRVGIYLDQYGIAVRTGHHCAQPTMQYYKIPGSIRASLAFYNTHDEIDVMINALRNLK